jgi:uncharacterized membrane protein
MTTWHVGFVLRQCRSVDRNFVHVSHVIVSITTIIIGMCVLCAVSALGEETVYIFAKVSDDFEVVYVLRLKK